MTRRAALWPKCGSSHLAQHLAWLVADQQSNRLTGQLSWLPVCLQTSFDSAQDMLHAKDRKLAQLQTQLATSAAQLAAVEQRVKGTNMIFFCYNRVTIGQHEQW